MNPLYKTKKEGSRNSFVLWAALLAFALLLSACGGGSAAPGPSAGSGTQSSGGASSEPAATKETKKSDVPSVLRVGYIGSNALNLPRGAEGWAFYHEFGLAFLKEYGITEVEFYGFPNGPDLNESLLSNRLDVGLYGDTPAISARSTGADTFLINQNAVGMNAYLVGQIDSGISSIHELKGKQIAVSKGSYIHRYLAGVLKKEGLYNDVEIIHLLPSDAIAALESKNVDAYAASSSDGPLLVDRGFPLIDSAEANPDFSGTSVTVVTGAYLKKNADFPQIWNDLRAKSIADLKTKEDDFYTFLAELYSRLSADLVKIAFPITEIYEEPIPEQGLQLLQGTKQFLIDEGLARNDFDIENDWIIRTK